MFLFKPFLYEVNNAFQLIQSLINICVVIFLFFFTKKCYKIKRVNTLFWLTFLIICFSIYGLVVVNFGTVSRYRFPFIVLLCNSLASRYY